MTDEIVNKVASSGIITIDLADFLPEEPLLAFDLKPLLWEGMVLREKDFRSWMKAHEWSQYKGKWVTVFCSADAIVPAWAYMLIASQLSEWTEEVVFGSPEEAKASILKSALSKLNPNQYKDKRVVVKGCGDTSIPDAAFLEITRILRPHVASLMYGEPCSTVPVFKKKSSRGSA